ncbi:N-acetyl-gamma-glutamyl-phosphate reductase [Micromonospora sp. WMMA1949]|uniref:N-acetyl-gamma-glutamyl-phosphate reductase n=1 Tax=unclassified Micromonospora TaxID=2617518 RepID=UPI0022B722A8|nr:N-acetyl-gamma-glutamyl-phosphate reductase [Micromonospora sp. WMMA1949]MCZ7428594.1 N-acetyl-gamma-glutamyl-phosphate reductase [Micromonospora sp. WMMA1949]
MTGGDLRIGIVGASGYLGGELLRLLLDHPRVAVTGAVSRRLAGRRVDGPHPHLRGLTDLAFVDPARLPACDVVFLSTPHRETMKLLPEFVDRAPTLIDLSGDFRLTDPARYERYYGVPHTSPELLGAFVPGYPERCRAELGGADRISVPGCMANAAVLALLPLADAGLVAGPVTVDGRVGSSGAGAGAGAVNTHAERSGAMRVFAPVSHRHETEIAQATGLSVAMSASGMPTVRGVQVVCRVGLTAPVREVDVRRLYRDRYRDEPFVRVVAERRGPHRLPEPKILLGSNFCDVGFALGVDGRELVAVAALDNLMKGGAGNAVQCLNIRMGWPERLGLAFPGLHPV